MDTSTARSTILTQRYGELQEWLQQISAQQVLQLTLLAGDASFRRYYRVLLQDKSYIIMDAPPERESCQPFVAIAASFKKHGVAVPEIYGHDLQRGFLWLSDLGDYLYLHKLTADNADELYTRAFASLIKIQHCAAIEDYPLPHYDASLLQVELNLFVEWYLEKYRQVCLTTTELRLLEQVFSALIASAQEQPQTCVHRDYHSRNLLVCDDGAVGVLDFQDAVVGPITYDLASLLKDCYIAWPQQQVESWVAQYYQLLQRHNLLLGCSYQQFLQWFDWMGLQRHLKCLGIFTRLHLRDQKSAYLNDIPRVLNYIRSVCQRYAELSALIPLLSGH